MATILEYRIEVTEETTTEAQAIGFDSWENVDVKFPVAASAFYAKILSDDQEWFEGELNKDDLIAKYVVVDLGYVPTA